MARNITNLANHPANGGIPASENRNADISKASTGAVWPSPEYEAISPERVRRPEVEGHGADLEGEPDEREEDRHREQGREVGAAGVRADLAEQRGTRQAEDQ